MNVRLPLRCVSMMLATLGVAAALSTPLWGGTPRPPKPPGTTAESRRLTEEKVGTLPTHEGLRLRLAADLGDVRILTQNSDQVSYKVRIEVDAREPGAAEVLKRYSLTARNTPAGVQLTGEVPSHDFHARFWINFEVSVPRNYNLDVLTQAGNIETSDIDGRVTLVTYGGNITAGRIGGSEPAGTRAAGASATPAARLETSGGHITVQDVHGDLRAITAGGHIFAGNVQGDVVLRTGGGHIRAGTIQGTAQLDTGGGNISVQRAGAHVSASTGGGQIEFGEVARSIRAHTGGGGIRVSRVAGPTQLETGGGSIFLTRVGGSVRASTGAGTITAWFVPEEPAEAAALPKARKPMKLLGASQLESGQGDIVVYLPRELAVTIDATIEMAADHRIEADPSLPVKVTFPDSGTGGSRGFGTVRGECELNGGGEVLRLKTVAGNIRLKLGDTDPQIRLQREQINELEHRLELHQQRLHEQEHRTRGQVEQRALALEDQRPKIQESEHPAGGLEELRRKFEVMWWGGVRVDPEMQQRKLIHSVRPKYPDVARHAGIQGAVRLRAIIAKDGSVQDVKVISGPYLLAQAAAEAVRQWRYEPTLMDDKPVSVVTTVTVEFKLQ